MNRPTHAPHRRTRRTKLNEVDLKRLEVARIEHGRKDVARATAYRNGLRGYHPLHNDLEKPLWALNAAARALMGLT